MRSRYLGDCQGVRTQACAGVALERTSGARVPFRSMRAQGRVRDAATWGGESAQEKMKLRATLTSRSRRIAGPGREGAEGPDGFPERPDDDVDSGVYAQVFRAAAAFGGTQGSGPVSIVEQHHSPVAAWRAFDHGAEGSQVSVHAVDAVDCREELRPGACLRIRCRTWSRLIEDRREGRRGPSRAKAAHRRRWTRD